MSESPGTNAGWFRAIRNPEAMELIAVSPNAFILAYTIAFRAQWSERFNRHGLALGEAFLGDHRQVSMTEQEYRTAKRHLEKWGFATFKPTNKGTIAKLTDSRLFEVLLAGPNGQDNDRPTDNQRTGNGQPTIKQRTANGQSFRLIDAKRRLRKK